MAKFSGFVIFLSLVFTVHAKTINTATITQLTLAASKDCIEYKIEGVCLWLRCIGPVCHITASPRVTHYLPDAVVSVYAHQGKNPWMEMSGLGKSARYRGGSVSTPIQKGLSQHVLRFKSADVIGNPTISTMSYLRKKFSCQSTAISFKPYFLSSLDSFSWIKGIPERLMPQSYVPGWREVGKFPLNTWGSVYPRVGFIANGERVKSAAVIAQRAGDIVTRRWQPHVYVPMKGCKGRGCQAPPPLKENDANTGKWQMLTPVAEKKCSVFGVNDALKLKSWGADKSDRQQQYAWNLWRKYTCCLPRKGIYIGHQP